LGFLAVNHELSHDAEGASDVESRCVQHFPKSEGTAWEARYKNSVCARPHQVDGADVLVVTLPAIGVTQHEMDFLVDELFDVSAVPLGIDPRSECRCEPGMDNEEHVVVDSRQGNIVKLSVRISGCEQRLDVYAGIERAVGGRARPSDFTEIGPKISK
jgi:hypothetical protein